MNLENELWHLTCLSDIFSDIRANFLGYEKIYDMSDTIEKIRELNLRESRRAVRTMRINQASCHKAFSLVTKNWPKRRLSEHIQCQTMRLALHKLLPISINYRKFYFTLK